MIVAPEIDKNESEEEDKLDESEEESNEDNSRTLGLPQFLVWTKHGIKIFNDFDQPNDRHITF